MEQDQAKTDQDRAKAENRKRLWELIEMAHERNKDIPSEVIERDIEQAIREVRAERRRLNEQRS